MQPAVGEDPRTRYRLFAARSAAGAGCGRGVEGGKINEAERARFRHQAHDWLRGDLSAWVKLAATAPPPGQAIIARAVREWQQTPDLAGVREANALDKLPDDERQRWRKLWLDVAELLGKTG
jgi:hypothetical protein